MAGRVVSRGGGRLARCGSNDCKMPANTLYATMLRDVKKRGGEENFPRVEEHLGRVRFFLNR